MNIRQKLSHFKKNVWDKRSDMFDIWTVLILFSSGLFFHFMGSDGGSIILYWLGVTLFGMAFIYVIALVLYGLWNFIFRRLANMSMRQKISYCKKIVLEDKSGMRDVWAVFILGISGTFFHYLGSDGGSIILYWLGVTLFGMASIYVIALVLYGLWAAVVRRLAKMKTCQRIMRFQKKVREDKMLMSDIEVVLLFFGLGAVLFFAGTFWDIMMLDLAGIALAGAAVVFVLASILYWLWTATVRFIKQDR